MASLLIERYQPLKALSSSFSVSVCVCVSFAKGHIKPMASPVLSQYFMSNVVIQMDGSQFYTEFNFYQTLCSMSVMSAL